MYGLLECDAAYLGGEVLMLRSNLLFQSSEYKNHTDAVSKMFQTTIKFRPEYTTRADAGSRDTGPASPPSNHWPVHNYKNNYL
jgi:hypothetical protein